MSSFEKLVLRGIWVIIHLLTSKSETARSEASKLLKDIEQWQVFR